MHFISIKSLFEDSEMNRTSRALKNSRVKVAVRCRPAFQDEIDFAKGEFVSIVQTKEESLASKDLGQVSLATISGKQRDFHYDYVFGEDTAQDYVYDRLARPIVNEVLRGVNGTIFAYGQTGTGKTYTMGILEFVNNEHAGLIPRAISQVFEHVHNVTSTTDCDVSITQSFIQLYREQIQDLLAPPSAEQDSLIIREDPVRGFYVEGLTEYVVSSYRESEALLNMGLENRAIAPTLMNATSSRSHTILTLNIEQRIHSDPQNPQQYSRTVRSKLLMVDLAGSERVRRTISRDTRLSEAKSINSSLSALGNVIAALADGSGHIPYRDSKLTRLLQDSLGGGAATALIATIGPAAVNYGETLSTLLFASRCMSVKIQPVVKEEVDYAEMCAKLTLQLGEVETKWRGELAKRAAEYEDTIVRLRGEVDELRASGGGAGLGDGWEGVLEEVRSLAREVRGEGEDEEQPWMNKDARFDLSALMSDQAALVSVPPGGQLCVALGFVYECLCRVHAYASYVLEANGRREDEIQQEVRGVLQREGEGQRVRDEELAAMFLHDPLRNKSKDKDKGEGIAVGRHLAPLSRHAARVGVEEGFASNNSPTSKYDTLSAQSSAGGAGSGFYPPSSSSHPSALFPQLSAHATTHISHVPSFLSFPSLAALLEATTRLSVDIEQKLRDVHKLWSRKDFHFQRLKDTLAEQMSEGRRREEEVVNWSYILRYLLQSLSKIRGELKKERKGGKAASQDQVPASMSYDEGEMEGGVPFARERSASAAQKLFDLLPTPSVHPNDTHPNPTAPPTTSLPAQPPRAGVAGREPPVYVGASDDEGASMHSAATPSSSLPPSYPRRSGSGVFASPAVPPPSSVPPNLPLPASRSRSNSAAPPPPPPVPQSSVPYYDLGLGARSNNNANLPAHGHNPNVTSNGNNSNGYNYYESPRVGSNHSTTSSLTSATRPLPPHPAYTSNAPRMSSSDYAARVARELAGTPGNAGRGRGAGAGGPREDKEMEDIILRVMHLSPRQLALLDEQTREQVRQVRRELGLDQVAGAGAGSDGMKQRSASAPRMRGGPATPGGVGNGAGNKLVGGLSRGGSMRVPPSTPSPLTTFSTPASRQHYSIQQGGYPAKPPPTYPPFSDDEDDDNFSQLDFIDSRYK